MPSTEPLDCVAFMLLEGERVLAEKRRVTKRLVPGAVALPGGHVEAGESIGDALHRELREELGVTAVGPTYVCTLLHRAEEWRKLHYFAVRRWRGAIAVHEADSLVWVPLAEPSRLDLDVDRIAVAEYLRVYAPSAGSVR